MAGIDHATVAKAIYDACRGSTVSVKTTTTIKSLQEAVPEGPSVAFYAGQELDRDDSLETYSYRVPIVAKCAAASYQDCLDIAQDVKDAYHFWGYNAGFAVSVTPNVEVSATASTLRTASVYLQNYYSPNILVSATSDAVTSSGVYIQNFPNVLTSASITPWVASGTSGNLTYAASFGTKTDILYMTCTPEARESALYSFSSSPITGSFEFSYYVYSTMNVNYNVVPSYCRLRHDATPLISLIGDKGNASTTVVYFSMNSVITQNLSMDTWYYIRLKFDSTTSAAWGYINNVLIASGYYAGSGVAPNNIIIAVSAEVPT